MFNFAPYGCPYVCVPPQLKDFRSYISTDKTSENHSDITSFCSENAPHNCEIEKVFTKFLFVHYLKGPIQNVSCCSNTLFPVKILVLS